MWVLLDYKVTVCSWRVGMVAGEVWLCKDGCTLNFSSLILIPAQARMTSEGNATKRTRTDASAIPIEAPSQRVRFSSGKLLWAKLVKESVAGQSRSRSTAVRQAEVYKCFLVFCHNAHFRRKRSPVRNLRAQACFRLRSSAARPSKITVCTTML